ncbi:Ig-like domain repeat protein [Ruania alkalisoli]|uniref:Ig-like domain repeat protein n=1 Tax=Ruania alkalisoli TaxID=2779775 RepID=A0A7M1SWC9_9MICO|nr:Ig-like domain-containing protein [Ruania alkalisoli]QOR71890.1 Ig-like domain repeat protein [Ruania alkalisoli]
MQQTPRARWRTALAAVTTAALTGAGMVAVAAPAQAAPTTLTFDDPSGTAWTVPAGVSSIEVIVVGAAGGGGETLNIPGTGIPLSGDGSGGAGAVITGTMGVSAGQTLTFYGSTMGGPVGTRHEPGGGGDGFVRGGQGNTGSLLGKAGGGGGGASAIVSGVAPLVVAGGGGGGGGRGAGFANCHGGHGGHSGEDGQGGYGICSGAGAGGAGASPFLYQQPGGPGSDAGNSSSGGGGGGGGGGYAFSGSGGRGSSVGGAGGGGGGGGGSFATVDALSTELDDQLRDGFVQITFDPTFATSTTVTAEPASGLVTGQETDVRVEVANLDTSEVPAGAVTLTDGDSSFGHAHLDGGEAVFRGVQLPVGTTTLSAEYRPDNEKFSGSAGTLDITVDPGQTTTTLQIDPEDAVHGQDVNLRALVAPVSPASGTVAGEVSFELDDGPLGTASVSDGIAELDIPADFIGTGRITASYEGSASFRSSASSGVTLAVDRAVSTLSLDLLPADLIVGETSSAVAMVGTAQPGAASTEGTVQFFVEGQPWGEPVDVDDDRATTPLDALTVAAGDHEISAIYSGNGERTAAESEPEVLSVAPADAHVTLEVAPDRPVYYGDVVTLDASIVLIEPAMTAVGGAIAFFAGDELLGTAPVTEDDPGTDGSGGGADGQTPTEAASVWEPRSAAAQLVLDGLSVGVHELHAQYLGTDSVNPARSEPVGLEVLSTPVLVTVATSPEQSEEGTEVTISAIVEPDTDSAHVPTGRVQLILDGTAWGEPLDLIDGGASTLTSVLPVGQTQVQARYLGDDGHEVGTSPEVPHTVTAAQIEDADSDSDGTAGSSGSDGSDATDGAHGTGTDLASTGASIGAAALLALLLLAAGVVVTTTRRTARCR